MHMESPLEFGEHESIVPLISYLMLSCWGTGIERDLSIVAALPNICEIRARESGIFLKE